MRLPTQLLRNNKYAHKNNFGHVLILAGSRKMLGAAALASLSAMRSGAGLVTVGIPKSLNEAFQEKSSNVVMSWPLNETKDKTISLAAFNQIKDKLNKFNAIAIGPGLTTDKSTAEFVLKVISFSRVPLIIDADALNIVAGSLKILTQTKTPKILTPHPGEMSRLTKTSKEKIEKNRREAALTFAKKYKCVLLLKGHKTVVTSPEEKVYINSTGNSGMATAGSGDVLTGMIAAFLAQGLNPFDAAKLGAYLHGKAGDLATKKICRTALIAEDIIDFIPKVFK